MNIYSIALFLHIVGALGFFVALGLEWTGLWQIRSAMTLEQVRAWMGILKNARKVGFVSMLTTVITGIYMMLTVWGGAAWIIVTLGSLVLMIVLSLVLTGPRMAAIGRALARRKDRYHKTSTAWRTTHSFGSPSRPEWPSPWASSFLKIAKPDLGGSLLTIGVAIVLGLASAMPMLRNEREQKSLAD